MDYFLFAVAAQKGPGIVIVHPGEDVELLCDLTTGTGWIVNNMGLPYGLNALFNGQLAGHSSKGKNIIVENITMNDDRNGSMYRCVETGTPNEGNSTYLYVAGEYQ